jgi:hypothetical protein
MRIEARIGQGGRRSLGDMSYDLGSWDALIAG